MVKPKHNWDRPDEVRGFAESGLSTLTTRTSQAGILTKSQLNWLLGFLSLGFLARCLPLPEAPLYLINGFRVSTLALAEGRRGST